MKTNYKKHALFGVVVLLILLAIILPTSKVYATTSITIATDGELMDIPLDMGAPFIDKTSTTMIPIRAISEKLGHNVEWDAKTKTVKIDDMETVGVIVNSRAYVPLRFVSEALGHKVEFTHANKRADGRHYVNIILNGGGKEPEKPNTGGKVEVPNAKLEDGVEFTTTKNLKAFEDLTIRVGCATNEFMMILDNAELIKEPVSFEIKIKGDWAARNKFKVQDFDGSYKTVDLSTGFGTNKISPELLKGRTDEQVVVARVSFYNHDLDYNTLKPLPLPKPGDLFEADVIAKTKTESAIYTVKAIVH